MNQDQLELLLNRAMPFGKYKGRVIADLPGHYPNWFAREGFLPGELGKLLALARAGPQRLIPSARSAAQSLLHQAFSGAL